jgi:hypothetical protein
MCIPRHGHRLIALGTGEALAVGGTSYAVDDDCLEHDEVFART